MPNTVSVEIYITRENLLDILSDESVEQVMITGDINLDSGDDGWNVEAFGYPGMSLAGKATCPRPCPRPNPNS